MRKVKETVPAVPEEWLSWAVSEVTRFCSDASRRPALVFVRQRNEVAQLVQRLNAAHFDVQGIHGGSSAVRRRKAIGWIAWVRGIVVCTDAWYKGVDIPTLRTVVDLTGGSSPIRLQQVRGRGDRIAEGKEESYFYAPIPPRQQKAQEKREKRKAILAACSPEDAQRIVAIGSRGRERKDPQRVDLPEPAFVYRGQDCDVESWPPIRPFAGATLERQEAPPPPAPAGFVQSMLYVLGAIGIVAFLIIVWVLIWFGASAPLSPSGF